LSSPPPRNDSPLFDTARRDFFFLIFSSCKTRFFGTFDPKIPPPPYPSPGVFSATLVPTSFETSTLFSFPPPPFPPFRAFPPNRLTSCMDARLSRRFSPPGQTFPFLPRNILPLLPLSFRSWKDRRGSQLWILTISSQTLFFRRPILSLLSVRIIVTSAFFFLNVFCEGYLLRRLETRFTVVGKQIPLALNFAPPESDFPWVNPFRPGVHHSSKRQLVLPATPPPRPQLRLDFNISSNGFFQKSVLLFRWVLISVRHDLPHPRASPSPRAFFHSLWL